MNPNGTLPDVDLSGFTQVPPGHPGFWIYTRQLPTVARPSLNSALLTTVARPDGRIAVLEHGTPVTMMRGYWQELVPAGRPKGGAK